jgi:hypothetical protein
MIGVAASITAGWMASLHAEWGLKLDPPPLSLSRRAALICRN